MAAQRKARGVKKRECTSCKKSDELNNRYCIFCGAEIQKRHMGEGNSAALEKFTQEISGVQDRRLTAKEQPPARAVAAAAPSKPGSFMVALVVYTSLAVLSAVAVAFSPTPHHINFARTFFTFVSPVKSGLVLYTKEPYVEVVLESADKTRYLLGSTGTSGSLAISDLDAGNYLARFSKAGFETVSQVVDVEKNRINLLGFDNPVELPKSYGEVSN